MPASTYGGKPIVDVGGRPAFAELAVLWTLQAEGWDGCWVTHGGKREIYRVGLMDARPVKAIPGVLLDVLDQVRAERGTSKGTWDVCVVRSDQLLFVECKRNRKDSISQDQISWLDYALNSVKIPIDSFLIVEWTLVGSSQPSRSPASRTPRPASTMAAPGNHSRDSDTNPAIYEPRIDEDYYRWLHGNRGGYVLNIRGRQQPMLHKSTCLNVKSHSVPGAMTERASRKICSASRAMLIDWLTANGFGREPRRCRSCSA